MTQNIWCRLLNLHKYEIIKEEPVLNNYVSTIQDGLMIVSRCTNCGKIKYNFIPTRNERGY